MSLDNKSTSAIEINHCEVCGNDLLSSVLNLGTHPLCDDLVTVGDTRVCSEYPIEILFCDRCRTAHQRFQVPKQTLFPKTYHYRSRFTADVLAGMSTLVDACESRLTDGLRGKTVLDIGCNDGSLLDFFSRKGAITFGVEPTDAFRDGLDKGHTILNGFFSPELAHEIKKKYGFLDVITFTNVFAHIENLSELINALKVLMSANTLLVIENHYLGAVLARQQFDTFYHEHPRTYSLTSFFYIAKSLDAELKDFDFPSRYGGNIRVFITGKTIIKPLTKCELDAAVEQESDFGVRLNLMQTTIDDWKKKTKSHITDLVNKHGLLFAKAFPGRAAILIKLLDIDVDMIAAVFEKPGSMKIGHYIPGTRIPIISDDEMFESENSPPVLINLAWHISSEIREYLTKRGYTGQIIDIITPKILE